METLKKFSKPFQKIILSQFRGLVRNCRDEYDRDSMALIRKSFDFLVSNSVEEQTLHGVHLLEYSTRLARMTVKELGLDALGASAALILHCVELNKIQVELVRKDVGDRTAAIVEELLKISNLDTTTSHGQSENMRNLILTLATDFRVILVKIAERLNLMRQMDLILEKERIALACEAKFIYSPLAHRLGLYNIMSEMVCT